MTTWGSQRRDNGHLAGLVELKQCIVMAAVSKEILHVQNILIVAELNVSFMRSVTNVTTPKKTAGVNHITNCAAHCQSQRPSFF